jgi:hypothetical protein
VAFTQSTTACLPTHSDTRRSSHIDCSIYVDGEIPTFRLSLDWNSVLDDVGSKENCISLGVAEETSTKDVRDVPVKRFARGRYENDDRTCLPSTDTPHEASSIFIHERCPLPSQLISSLIPFPIVFLSLGFLSQQVDMVLLKTLVLLASLSRVSQCHLSTRATCADGYTECHPDGATLREVPPLGGNWAFFYESILEIVPPSPNDNMPEQTAGPVRRGLGQLCCKFPVASAK